MDIIEGVSAIFPDNGNIDSDAYCGIYNPAKKLCEKQGKGILGKSDDGRKAAFEWPSSRSHIFGRIKQ